MRNILFGLSCCLLLFLWCSFVLGLAGLETWASGSGPDMFRRLGPHSVCDHHGSHHSRWCVCLLDRPAKTLRPKTATACPTEMLVGRFRIYSNSTR